MSTNNQTIFWLSGEKGYKKIAVKKIENKGIGLAINDRLQKASKKK